ncbi:MAG: purine-nucleoside phosphorylase [Bacteroidota bacterium]
MSLHISAEKGEIAPTVLLPGDPLRAKYIAENYFENPKLYNEVRGMLGYTGQYQGQPISAQGSGMGMPSLSIYVNELIDEYDVKTIVRVGTCGSFQKELEVGKLVIGMAASTDSAINSHIFHGYDYAPCANAGLFTKAVNLANDMSMPFKAGPIVSTDRFYLEDIRYEPKWEEYGLLATDMESSALYTLCARRGVRALSILTVSDNLVTGEFASQEARENSFGQMIDLALAVVS